MTIYGDEVRNPSLSANKAENQRLNATTPGFPPKNVKSGVFSSNRRIFILNR